MPAYHNYIGNLPSHWQAENTIEVEKQALRLLEQKICNDPTCRYPLLSLRLLIHLMTSIDEHGHVAISARQLSKKLGVNYDTVTKCLKYLRTIRIIEQKR